MVQIKSNYVKYFCFSNHIIEHILRFFNHLGPLFYTICHYMPLYAIICRPASYLSALYHVTTFQPDITGHLSNFFKKSIMSLPAVIVCVFDFTLWEHLVHLQRHLIPRQTVNIVQPKHDPQFALLDSLYVLLHL